MYVVPRKLVSTEIKYSRKSRGNLFGHEQVLLTSIRIQGVLMKICMLVSVPNIAEKISNLNNLIIVMENDGIYR